MIENILSSLTSFLASDLTASYIPAILFCLGFFETLGFVGLFLPLEIPAILGLARLIHTPYQLGLAGVMLGLGIFCGLICGYFFGKTFLKNVFENIMKKFPMFEDELEKTNKLVQNNPKRSFPILINVGFVRPLLSVYFGSHAYENKKYILGSFLASLGYSIPRIVLGVLVGIFGKQFLDHLSIDKKYIIGFFVLIFLISIVKEFLEEKKHEKKQ